MIDLTADEARAVATVLTYGTMMLTEGQWENGGVEGDPLTLLGSARRKLADPSSPEPDPAPEIIMDANGNYWRRYPTHLSMVPVSTDNDPLATPIVVYRPVPS